MTFHDVMGETLRQYDKWYIILKLGISIFSTSTNQKNYFPTLTARFVGVGHIWTITLSLQPGFGLGYIGIAIAHITSHVACVAPHYAVSCIRENLDSHAHVLVQTWQTNIVMKDTWSWFVHCVYGCKCTEHLINNSSQQCPIMPTYNLAHNSSALRNTSAGYWAYLRVVNMHASCVRAAAHFACITWYAMAQ